MTSVSGLSTKRLQHNLLTALLFGTMIALVGVGSVFIVSPDRDASYGIQRTSVAVADPERAGLKLLLSNPGPQIPDVVLAPIERDTVLYNRAPVSEYDRAVTSFARAPVTSSSEGTGEGMLPQKEFAKVAIIIDDMGHSPRHSGAALNLPKEVALALLPYARASKSLAKSALARGHELIVHMPMQPKDTHENPGPNSLRAGASEADIREAIAWNLDQFDGYYAVNNHMGSAFTEDQLSMQILFQELSKRGLAFYDSRTTAASKSVDLAARFGVNMAERDVFLDNDVAAVAVDKQLARLEQLALRNGSAIAIGHPHSVTFEQITLWAKTLQDRGLVLVPPSDVMADRGTPYWRNIVKTAGRAIPPNAGSF